MNYKQTYNGPSKVDYAVPTDFRSTFSVGLATRPKKVGAETRDNVKSELKLVTRTLVEKPGGFEDQQRMCCGNRLEWHSQLLTVHYEFVCSS